MRTAIIDDILRRIETRGSTGEELRRREERRRDVAQLVSEIAAEPEREREGRGPRERRVG